MPALKSQIQGIFMPIFKEMIHNGNQEETEHSQHLFPLQVPPAGDLSRRSHRRSCPHSVGIHAETAGETQ